MKSESGFSFAMASQPFEKVKYVSHNKFEKVNVKCFLRLEAAHCHNLRVHEQQQHHFHDHQQIGPEKIICECSPGCCRGCTFLDY